MNIKEIKTILKNAGIEEFDREAQMFSEHFLGLDAVKLAINPDFEPTKELIEAINLRCNSRMPIQYILGKAYFMKEYFEVNKYTLIPRDETEILVRKAISIINAKELNTVLDIGTGSGCIACIIAKLTHANVLGVDISSDALKTAINNAEKLNLFNKVFFRKSDLFSNVREKFDLIVSNPPYVMPKEKQNLQTEVRFEPESAIFAPDDSGVYFYKKIIENSKNFINKNGYIIFELGINQSELVKDMMIKTGFCDILIEKDLAGIDRVISGRKDD